MTTKAPKQTAKRTPSARAKEKKEEKPKRPAVGGWANYKPFCEDTFNVIMHDVMYTDLNLRTICAKVGLDNTTFYRWLDLDEDYHARYLDAQRKRATLAIDNLHELVESCHEKNYNSQREKIKYEKWRLSTYLGGKYDKYARKQDSLADQAAVLHNVLALSTQQKVEIEDLNTRLKKKGKEEDA